MSISVALKTSDIERISRSIGRGGRIDGAVRSIIQRTINEVARQTATQGRRIVQERLNMKAGQIKETIQVKPNNFATKDWINVKAIVVFKYKPFPIYRVPGGRQTKKGYSVRIVKTKGRKVLKSAFVATMPNTGHTGVFKRKTKLRLTIHEKFTTTPWNIVNHPDNLRALEAFVVRRLPIVMVQKSKAFRPRIGTLSF